MGKKKSPERSPLAKKGSVRGGIRRPNRSRGAISVSLLSEEAAEQLLDQILGPDDVRIEVDAAAVEELEARLDELLEVAAEDEGKLNRLLGLIKGTGGRRVHNRAALGALAPTTGAIQAKIGGTMAAKKGTEASKRGESHTPDPPAVTPATGAMPSRPPTEVVQEVRGPDGRYLPGNRTIPHRGPDRKPRRDLVRMMMTHALALPQKRGGKMVRHAAVGDMVLCFTKLARGQRLPNTRGFIDFTKLAKEIFDDAPDSGSGRTTRFIFASEVEAEMKNGGQPEPCVSEFVVDDHGVPPAVCADGRHRSASG